MGWHVHLLKHIKNLQLTNELEVFVFYYNIALLAKIIKIYMINKIFSNHFNPLIIVRSTLFYYNIALRAKIIKIYMINKISL